MNKLNMMDFPRETNLYTRFIAQNENVKIEFIPDTYEVLNTGISTSIHLYFINRKMREKLKPFVGQAFSITEIHEDEEFCFSNMNLEYLPSVTVEKNDEDVLESKTIVTFYRLG